MAVDWSTGNQSLAKRTGLILHALRSAIRFENDTAISGGTPDVESIGASHDEIVGQFTSNDLEIVDKFHNIRNTGRNGLAGYKSEIVTALQDLWIEQVDRTEILQNKTLGEAWEAAIVDMIDSGTIYSSTDDFNGNEFTVAATATADTTSNYGAGNNGNGVILTSDVQTDGRDSQFIYAETLEFVVTADGQGDGTARQENIQCNGETEITDKLDTEWPGGSGASATVAIGDATADSTDTNLLQNSEFNAFTTSNKPDYWGDPVVGAYGTDIFEETAQDYRSGVSVLEFQGTGGSPLSEISQKFNESTLAVGNSGNSSELKPNTVYAVNCFIKKSASLLAGNLKIRLMDQAGTPALTTDDASTNNELSVAHGSITTSYASFGGFFRTPRVLPTTGLALSVQISTALTSGESIFIADLCMIEATELYNGGIYAAAFAGSTNFITGDRFTLAPTQSATSEFMTYLWRAFDIPNLGTTPPFVVDGSETIADSLMG